MSMDCNRPAVQFSKTLQQMEGFRIRQARGVKKKIALRRRYSLPGAICRTNGEHGGEPGSGGRAPDGDEDLNDMLSLVLYLQGRDDEPFRGGPSTSQPCWLIHCRRVM